MSYRFGFNHFKHFIEVALKDQKEALPIVLTHLPGYWNSVKHPEREQLIVSLVDNAINGTIDAFVSPLLLRMNEMQASKSENNSHQFAMDLRKRDLERIKNRKRRKFKNRGSNEQQ